MVTLLSIVQIVNCYKQLLKWLRSTVLVQDILIIYQQLDGALESEMHYHNSVIYSANLIVILHPLIIMTDAKGTHVDCLFTEKLLTPIFRSVQMRLYSMHKREFVMVFIAFFSCFGLGVFIGLAGLFVVVKWFYIWVIFGYFRTTYNEYK